MTTIVLSVLAGCLATVIFFIATRRQRVPQLRLDARALPQIESGLEQIAGLTTGHLLRGNAARLLQNERLFRVAREDIAAARHTVHLETFIWRRGRVEAEFVDLLCRKADEGVSVRILADFLGSKDADPEQLARLRAHGVVFVNDRRSHLLDVRRFNNRIHRKILVVDGRVGYTFGHGIADTWLGDAEDKDHWRDTGIRLEGPVVADLQSVFVKDWISAHREIPAGEGSFPPLEAVGDAPAHVVASFAADNYSSVALLYMLAIGSAQGEVIIQNPYFTPDPAIPRLLQQLARAGVAVHLMVPGRFNDSQFIRRAGQYLYQSMLECGVRLYEFEPTLLHQKIVIVDGVWAHVGSTNFDARSLALNTEIGIGILDRGIAQELRKAFFVDLRRCREVRLPEWKQRTWYQRLLDRAAYMLHDQI